MDAEVKQRKKYKPVIGRKLKTSDKKFVGFRASPILFKAIEAAANKEGRTISSFLNHLLEEVL
jgi:hypothetical protein